MSGEKIDLADLAFSARLPLPPVSAEEVLALVAAVRAAREVLTAQCGFSQHRRFQSLHALDAALSPFTDSAEVRSDD